MNDSSHVAVVGGGPAGSTAAAFLARAGVSVRLFERAVFPRYHVGESLVAGCRMILRASGALPAVEQHGFQVKHGLMLHWKGDKWQLDFSKHIGPRDGTSFQVDRASFDEILLRNAASQGAAVIEGATVRSVDLDDGRPVALHWTDDAGQVHEEAFDYLVDATGRTGLMATGDDRIRIPHKIFQNVAIWAYWPNGRLLPGSVKGATNMVSSDDGWYWVIPLADGTLSVGYVMTKESFRRRRPTYSTLTEMYLSVLAKSPDVRALVDGCEMSSEVRAEQDFSYTARRFAGPGHIIVGDAACFLDPLMSPGVYHALYSGFVGAASLVSAIRGDVPEAVALEFYEHCYRRAYTRMLSLSNTMLDGYAGAEEFIDYSRRLVPSAFEQRPRGATVQETANGLVDWHETTEGYWRSETDSLVYEAGLIDDSVYQGRTRFDSHFANLRVSLEPVFGLAQVDQDAAVTADPQSLWS